MKKLLIETKWQVDLAHLICIHVSFGFQLLAHPLNVERVQKLQQTKKKKHNLFQKL